MITPFVSHPRHTIEFDAGLDVQARGRVPGVQARGRGEAEPSIWLLPFAAGSMTPRIHSPRALMAFCVNDRFCVPAERETRGSNLGREGRI